MKKNFILNLFGLMLVLLMAVGCQMGEFSGYTETESGMFYKFYEKSNDTVKPAIGDLLSVKMQYGTKDSIVFNSKDNPTGEDLILPLSEPEFAGDIYDALMLMSVGDSAGFILKADSFFLVTAHSRSIPDYVDTTTNAFYFYIRLVSAQSREEFDQAEVERKEVLKREEKVILEQYLADNEITTKPLPSGLYFIETKSGHGAKPKEGDWTKIHFEVKLMDGPPLFSSWDNNAPMDIEIGKPFDTPGATEALSLMKVGSVVDLIVPSEIAFGEAGRSQMVPPYATVLYKLEMISIMSAKEHKAEQDRIRREQMAKFDKNKVESERFLGENSKKDGVVVLPSGLQYKVITTGEGPIPQASDKVKVHYHGTIIDGTVFDSSVERGTPSEFQVTGVIEGWQEALQLMPVGSKWVLYIPSDLAYKDNARGQVIEPNMALVFEVELLEILGSGE